MKKEESLLWVPRLSMEEVEELFNSTSLKKFNDDIWKEMNFWKDEKLIDLKKPLPYKDGEIFSAESWNLIPI